MPRVGSVLKSSTTSKHLPPILKTRSSTCSSGTPIRRSYGATLGSTIMTLAVEQACELLASRLVGEWVQHNTCLKFTGVVVIAARRTVRQIAAIGDPQEQARGPFGHKEDLRNCPRVRIGRR